MSSKEAVLFVSFGGPEGPDDVLPFLRNVLRGRAVPEERMREVERHYALFGGVSPINAQNRALIAALEGELALHGPALPVYWGNRNWHPLLEEALRAMAAAGIERAYAFVTSAFSSYSGCRQYREDIERARTAVGAAAPEVLKLRAFYNHPGFIEANVERLRAALEEFEPALRRDVPVAFTAHSIPRTMAAGCAYEAQLHEACALVAGAAGVVRHALVFQSRSGPPSQPWLEPDIGDHLETLARAGERNVIVAPIGFLSDHMEVVYDLDTEARALAQERGLRFVRAGAAGPHPAVARMILELVVERREGRVPRTVAGSSALPDVCALDCCLPGSGRPA